MLVISRTPMPGRDSRQCRVVCRISVGVKHPVVGGLGTLGSAPWFVTGLMYRHTMFSSASTSRMSPWLPSVMRTFPLGRMRAEVLGIEVWVEHLDTANQTPRPPPTSRRWDKSSASWQGEPFHGADCPQAFVAVGKRHDLASSNQCASCCLNRIDRWGASAISPGFPHL